MQYEVQNSSTTRPLLFFMADSADHITGKTGLSPTVVLSKNGAAFGSPSGAVTEIANGWYKVAGNATDNATNGPLALHASATGADPDDRLFMVVPWNPDDAVRLGLTSLPNAAAEAAGGLYTRGTGAGQIKQTNNGEVDSNTTHWNNLATVALPLIPTTPGRTLDVSAGGEAGIDWANIGTPGSTVSLSATTVAVVTTTTTVTNQLTAAAIATGVWQDTTAGDFTVASSIGKCLYVGNIAPGASGGHFISGSNAGTTTFGALTVTGATTHTGAVTMGAGFAITGAMSIFNASGVGLTILGTTGAINATASNGDGFTTTGSAGNIGFKIVGGAYGIKIDPIDTDGISIWADSGLTGGAALKLVAHGAGKSILLSRSDSPSFTEYPGGGEVFGAGFTTHSGTAQAGSTSTTIKLASTASATNSFYVGAQVNVVGGTGALQGARTITAYNGTTKVATIDFAWITTPDATSNYAIQGTENPSLDSSLQVAATGSGGGTTNVTMTSYVVDTETTVG